jgi:predicted transcriptional regulator of viral defense system
MTNPITTQKAIGLFRMRGGMLRTSEAIRLGINPKTLYAMRNHGLIEMMSRGVYRLTDETLTTDQIDLALVIKRIPKGIICLTSALAFHELTSQIPHYVYVAYQQGWRQPKLDYPPIKIFRYSKNSFAAGVEYHKFNGIQIPVYSAAKTVVDCFKFRNKIGLDVAVEALKNYWHKHKKATVSELVKYARICRVDKVMKPYIEAILHA